MGRTVGRVEQSTLILSALLSAWYRPMFVVTGSLVQHTSLFCAVMSVFSCHGNHVRLAYSLGRRRGVV